MQSEPFGVIRVEEVLETLNAGEIIGNTRTINRIRVAWF